MSGTHNVLQHMVHLRQSVVVFEGAFVEVVEINTQTDLSVLLSYWHQIRHP